MTALRALAHPIPDPRSQDAIGQRLRGTSGHPITKSSIGVLSPRFWPQAKIEPVNLEQWSRRAHKAGNKILLPQAATIPPAVYCQLSILIVGDFHGLRHTCGTWLAAPGAHSKVIQSIIRHSTITLIMDTYVLRLIPLESQTLVRLPDVSLPPESQKLQVTGTTDTPVDYMACSGAFLCVKTMNSMEPDGILAMQGQDAETPPSMQESCGNQVNSTNWRRWESNPHLRIANAPSSH